MGFEMIPQGLFRCEICGQEQNSHNRLWCSCFNCGQRAYRVHSPQQDKVSLNPLRNPSPSDSNVGGESDGSDQNKTGDNMEIPDEEYKKLKQKGKDYDELMQKQQEIKKPEYPTPDPNSTQDLDIKPISKQAEPEAEKVFCEKCKAELTGQPDKCPKCNADLDWSSEDEG